MNKTDEKQISFLSLHFACRLHILVLSQWPKCQKYRCYFRTMNECMIYNQIELFLTTCILHYSY